MGGEVDDLRPVDASAHGALMGVRSEQRFRAEELRRLRGLGARPRQRAEPAAGLGLARPPSRHVGRVADGEQARSGPGCGLAHELQGAGRGEHGDRLGVDQRGRARARRRTAVLAPSGAPPPRRWCTRRWRRRTARGARARAARQSAPTARSRPGRRSRTCAAARRGRPRRSASTAAGRDRRWSPPRPAVRHGRGN